MTSTMRYPVLTPEEAVTLIPNGATVSFSGFSPAGAAKVIPRALAARARQEHEAGQRLEAFVGYQVDSALMAEAAPDAIFMHDLPAHRGEETVDEVIDGPQSVVLDQAENRLHAQRA
ncbi:MAG: hypothetical protein HGB17_08290, partial [Syntrophobacteraceae bacterium]|nr:hypothetical protein [Syntrophobacteraceae bacterium]